MEQSPKQEREIVGRDKMPVDGEYWDILVFNDGIVELHPRQEGREIKRFGSGEEFTNWARRVMGLD